MAIGYKFDLNDLFGPSVGYIATSPDGETWTITSYDGVSLRAIAYGSSRFVVVGTNGCALMCADNGEWERSSNISYTSGAYFE